MAKQPGTSARTIFNLSGAYVTDIGEALVLDARRITLERADVRQLRKALEE